MYTQICLVKGLDTCDRKYRRTWITLPANEDMLRKYRNHLIVDSNALFDIDMSDKLVLVNRKAEALKEFDSIEELLLNIENRDIFNGLNCGNLDSFNELELYDLIKLQERDIVKQYFLEIGLNDKKKETFC